MVELLEQIERLDQAAQYASPPGPSRPGDQDTVTGAVIDTTLAELRAQLDAMMKHALELDSEIADQGSGGDPADQVSGSRTGANNETGDRAAPFSGPFFVERGHDQSVRWGELSPYRNGRDQIGRGEGFTEVHSDGLAIRVIPPNPADAGPDGGGRSLTLVFDLGSSQPPVRVSLPIDAPVAPMPEQKPAMPSPQLILPSRPSGRRMVAAIAVAIVLISVGFVAAMWAGAAAPNAATATSQSPRPVVAAPPAAAAGSSGEARALREQPTMRAPVVATIPNGTQVEVLDGAELADGYAWLRVRTSDGRVGWVASAAQGSGNIDLRPATPTSESQP
jgi:hypothetical protein